MTVIQVITAQQMEYVINKIVMTQIFIAIQVIIVLLLMDFAIFTLKLKVAFMTTIVILVKYVLTKVIAYLHYVLQTLNVHGINIALAMECVIENVLFTMTVVKE